VVAATLPAAVFAEAVGAEIGVFAGTAGAGVDAVFAGTAGAGVDAVFAGTAGAGVDAVFAGAGVATGCAAAPDELEPAGAVEAEPDTALLTDPAELDTALLTDAAELAAALVTDAAAGVPPGKNPGPPPVAGPATA
jgi:hypothetical protein